MCGFAGFIDSSRSQPSEALRDVVLRMADTLRHRGPDDRGSWEDPAAGVALGFRRLSIVDLSPNGHQPMKSAGGRYVITFNGEIYNFRALRRQVEEHWGDNPISFRGHSDTEVLLAAIEAWGLRTALERTVGMFAFALWDRRDRSLSLARDRMGEKPLYYGWMRDTFLFGSELKALRAHPNFDSRVNRDALPAYLRHGYISCPQSIYTGVHKLPPGTFLTLENLSRGSLPEPTEYWSARDAAEAGAANPFDGSDADALQQLGALLREAVAQEMVADVPLGAFLSGGIDSSTIVALMQSQSTRPVKTFTIGFHESRYNEASYASAVASRLGTEHTELYVTPQETMDVIPRLPVLYDEPFADSSQIPTFLVSELASRSVKVSLSGDGGDEIFAGYDWYPRTMSVWNKLRRFPSPLRAVAAAGFRAGSGITGSEKLRRVSELAAQGHAEGAHEWLLSKWTGAGPALRTAEGIDPLTGLNDGSRWARSCDPLAALQCFDMLTYLPDGILTKVDRASMGASIESRAPLLDHRIVEFAFRLPDSMRRRAGQGKWLLRQLLYQFIPESFFARPKGGFNVPIADWLRGPLAGWAEDLLAERRLREQGFFDPKQIRRKWDEHRGGKHDWQDHLWHVLMFQAWLEAR